MEKRKIFIGIATLVVIIAISLLTLQPKPAEAAWCSWGYRSTTSWPGQCVACNCLQWDHTGRTSCPDGPIQE